MAPLVHCVAAELFISKANHNQRTYILHSFYQLVTKWTYLQSEKSVAADFKSKLLVLEALAKITHVS